MDDGRRRELTKPPNVASTTGVLLRLPARRYATDASTQPGDMSNGPVSTRWDSSRLPLVAPESYEVSGEIAHGGIGRILKGKDQRLGRTVALKELLSGGGTAEERFVREALVTARLQHPSIVPVYEAGRWPTGEPFYAMKLVSGRSLSEVIATTKTLDQRLALLPHALAVAEAVAYAHSERIIHRDLKPSNVLVGAFGETVVIDWGLAKDLDERLGLPADGPPSARTPNTLLSQTEGLSNDDPPDSSSGTRTSSDGAVETPPATSSGDPGLTMAGAVLGTPSYMPPEQAKGEAVDERADVYALGAILYHVLAGVPPYTGKTSLDILKKALAGPPLPLEELQLGVPQDLVTIVNKAMSRDIADRYRTAKELADDLRRFQTGQIVGAHKYSRMERLLRFGRRHRAAASVAGAALVLLAAGAFVSVRGILEARTRAEEERDRAAQKQVEAEAAQSEAMLRADELTLAQARDMAPRDPNNAIALLRMLSPKFSRWGVARTIAADAKAHGIARVIRHPASVNAAEMSPDGAKLATGCDDKIVRIIDLATGHAHELAGHTDEVYWVKFSEDGRRLISNGKDQTLREWDLEGGTARVVASDVGAPIAPADIAVVAALSRGSVELIDVNTGERTALGPGEPFWTRYAFSQNGRTLAFATRGKLAFFDVKTRRTKRFPEKKKPIRALAVTARGELVAAGDANGTIYLIDAATGAERSLSGHSGEVALLAFSPDGKTLVSLSQDRTARFWDVAAGTSREVEGHDGRMHHVRFSKDGRMVASVGSDRTVRVWDVSGREGRLLRGFEDAIFDVTLSPDGRFVAAGGFDHTVRVWDLASMGSRLAAVHAAQVPVVAISPDGKLIASASADGDVRLTHAASVLPEGAAIAPPEGISSRLSGRRTAPKRLLFSPDGRRLARAGEDGALEVWKVPDGSDPTMFSGHAGPIYDMVFSIDGNFVYSAGADRTVRRWDLNQGSGVVLYEHAGTVGKLALSIDGTHLASGGEDRVLRVWHLGEGRERLFSGHTGPITAVTFSPDGKWVLTGSEDHTFRVWNLDSGGSNMHGIAGPMHNIGFSPDGRSFFLQGFVNTLGRWEAATQKRLEAIRGHAAPIWDFAISPEGVRVVTGSLDRTVRITDLATGEGRALAGHWDEVLSVAYLPDGKSVVSGGKDGAVRLWMDDLPDSVAELQGWLGSAVPEEIKLGVEAAEQERSN